MLRINVDMKKNKNISNLIEKYYESTRYLWNTYFRFMEDGVHRFIDINAVLFDGLVLADIQDIFEHNKVYKTIKVVPVISGSKSLSIQYLPNGAVSGSWQNEIIIDSTGEYLFIEFFDWRNEKDIMENKFVMVLALDVPCNQKLNGNRVLFEYKDVYNHYYYQ